MILARVAIRPAINNAGSVGLCLVPSIKLHKETRFVATGKYSILVLLIISGKGSSVNFSSIYELSSEYLKAWIVW